jgi:hypothetical protein
MEGSILTTEQEAHARGMELVQRALGNDVAKTLQLAMVQSSVRAVKVDFDGDGIRDVNDLVVYDDVLAGAVYQGAGELDTLQDGVIDERDREALYASFAGSATFDDLLALQVDPPPNRLKIYVTAEAGQELPEHARGCERADSIALALRMCQMAGGGGLILLGTGIHDAYVGGGWQRDALTYGGKPGKPLIIATDPQSPTRAILRLPSSVGAGVRMTDGVSHVTLRGLHFVCSRGQEGVVISGTASDINIVDCIIDGYGSGSDGNGGWNGIRIEGYGPNAPGSNGVDKRPTRIFIGYNMIYGQSYGTMTSGPHCQGIYASNYGQLDIVNNLLWKCGKLGSQFDHAIYLVHGALTRPRVIGNFIGMPGSAAIQLRGTGYGEAGWNIGFWCNTVLGLGHPMGYRDGVWSNVRAHNNLCADPRSGATAPAGWGISHMAGAVNDMSHNVLRGFAGGGVAGPAAIMTSQTQGGGAANVPVGEFSLTGLRISGEASNIDWYAELATRLSRQHGQWNEQVHGTRQLIESMRARTPLRA